MPKLKIRKSISSRFKVTKTGKLLFRGSHVRHLARKKSKSSLRSQRKPKIMTGLKAKKIIKLLGR